MAKKARKPKATAKSSKGKSKATPSKATPSKATPSKATPSKATPSKATPSKATPSKANPAGKKGKASASGAAAASEAGGDLPAAKLWKALSLCEGLSRERDFDALLAQILDAAVELVEAERGFILLRSDGTPADDFTVRCARNFDKEEILGARTKVSKGIVFRVFKTGRTEIIESAGEHPIFSTRRSVRDQKLRSVIVAPLRRESEVIGAIYLDNRFAVRVFGESEGRLMGVFAAQAEVALQTARHLAELAANAAELERLNAELASVNERNEALILEQQTKISVLDRELDLVRDRVSLQARYRRLRGRSPALRRVLSLMDRVAESDETVLITGETGTGKELVARALHANSDRRNGHFVAVNCAAISAQLLESELFGHLEGSWTGASRDREGLIVKAGGGTLFLDEVTELPLDLQSKLLRVLEEREVRPLGSDEPRPVDVRVLAASNRDLQKEVKAGTFREDLYYRLNILPIQLPPLRDRSGDIPILVDHFLEEIALRNELPMPHRITRGAMEILESYRWPGNVRQLRNEIERAVVIGGDTLTMRDFTHLGRPMGGGDIELLPPRAAKLEEVEKISIEKALDATRGHVRKAADILGIHHSTLYRKLKHYDIDVGPRLRPRPRSA